MDNENKQFDFGFYKDEIISSSVFVHLFFDINGDGIQDVDEGDISNNEVTITTSNGDTITYLTDLDGNVEFKELPIGSTILSINVLALDGYILTVGNNPETFNLLDNENKQFDFGFYKDEILGIGSFEGSIYYSDKCNNIIDGSDNKAPTGIKIKIINEFGSEQIISTDSDGKWNISLQLGNYNYEIIEEDSPLNFADYILYLGNLKGSFEIQDNESTSILISLCEMTKEKIVIYSEAYYDDNGNGIHDECEIGIPNLKIIVEESTSLFKGEVKTTINGSWSMESVEGEYIISHQLSEFENYVITEGEEVLDKQFIKGQAYELDRLGVFIPKRAKYILEGNVYFDSNKNYLKEPNETSLSSLEITATVTLSNNETYVVNSNIDDDGKYQFLLPAGEVSTEINFDNIIDRYPNFEVFEGNNPFETTYDVKLKTTCDYEVLQQNIGVSYGLKVYNAISPNNDGVNDYFKIDGIENFPSNILRVVNRWGDEVYITDSYGFGNNLFYGKTGGNIKTAKNKVLPKGTYFYFLDYYDGLNYKKQQGFININ